jgi:glycine/D-amino acid oxidase-like deaminating enzyme
MLIGGGDEDFYDAEKRDSLLNKKEKEILKTLKKIKPDYHFYTDFVWAGTFGETKDGLPYIGNIKILKILILYWFRRKRNYVFRDGNGNGFSIHER